MIDRRVEIISLNEEDKNFFRTLKRDKNGKLERHAIGLREFIKEKNLEYEGYEEDATYNLALYLVSLGYLVFLGESLEKSMIFIPQKIVEKQYTLYLNNKKILKRIDLAILDYNESFINEFDEVNLCGEKPFNKLRDIIEDKEIIKNKQKTI